MVESSSSPNLTKKRETTSQVEYTHRGMCGIKTARTPKQQFMFILKKLFKMSKVLEKDEDFAELSVDLINLMLKAKPLVPKQKLGYIYQEEPRPLLHARRKRKYQFRASVSLSSSPCLQFLHSCII